MALNWFQLAALLGSAQGFLLAGVLARQERNRTGNRILSVAMVAFSIYLLTVVYHAVQFEQVWPHFFGIGYPMPLLYGPLVYLYAVTTSDRTRHLHRWDALHFIPFAAVVIAGFPIYAMSGTEKLAFYQELQQGERPALLAAVDPMKLISGVSYAVATIVFLRRHQNRMKDSYSSLERVNLRWLLRLAGAAAAIWALAATLDLAERLHHPLVRRGDDVVALAVAILVYGIGYMALRQPEIFHFSASEHRAPRPSIPEATTPPTGDPPARRYERSGLGEPEARALEHRLLALMDSERPFQDSELSLDDLAGRLDTTPHKLSEVLNTELGQSFYDFVNAYRVREVQRRIADGRSKHLTILSLAVDAGFSSKSTFNQVFKRHTRQTPSEYRKSVGG